MNGYDVVKYQKSQVDLILGLKPSNQSYWCKILGIKIKAPKFTFGHLIAFSVIKDVAQCRFKRGGLRHENWQTFFDACSDLPLHELRGKVLLTHGKPARVIFDNQRSKDEYDSLTRDYWGIFPMDEIIDDVFMKLNRSNF